MDRIAIVGAGLAGSTLARKLRALGFEGRIALFGDEGLAPYNRPPLSKAYLAGELAQDNLWLRPHDSYAKHGIDLYPDRKITAIDPARCRLVLHDGAEGYGYDALALTTGARARPLPTAMARGLSGLYTLRGMADADRIGKALGAAGKLLVIGGGYIGLEIAATARKKGCAVTLVEAGPRILARVAAAPTSDYFRNLHQSHGVDIREGIQLDHLTGEGHVSGAVLSDGSRIEADCVIVGIGILPDADLARDAGLEVDSAIRTDALCRTSDTAIWAAGDCASFPIGDGMGRLESVGNAIDMAECAAENMLGAEKPYRPKPWFWSDQFDARLQIAGLGTGYDRIVIRPGKKHNAVSHWYFRGDRLLAADVLNEPKSYMLARRLIESGISPPPDAVADAGVDLKTFL